jgi:hypothetical protein
VIRVPHVRTHIRHLHASGLERVVVVNGYVRVLVRVLPLLCVEVEKVFFGLLGEPSVCNGGGGGGGGDGGGGGGISPGKTKGS